MPNLYKGRLFSICQQDEKALSILRVDLAEKGYAASRSAAVRYALHATVRGLIADTAGLKRVPAPADIAAAIPADLP